MRSGDVRTFFSQIASKSGPIQGQPVDLNYLSTNGYVSVMPKDDYDRTSANVAALTQKNMDLYDERVKESQDEAAMMRDEGHTHSFLFHLEGREQKEAELQKLESEKVAVQTERLDISQKDAEITQLIQKKSTIDRFVQYNGQYVALTGLGIMTLSDLNVRNYRVSDVDFTQFIGETHDTTGVLKSVAEKGTYHVSNLKSIFPIQDLTQLWGVSIGLGKIQGDPNLIGDRFLLALKDVENFGSTLEDKMAAAEIITSVRPTSNLPPSDNSDIQNNSKTLSGLEHDLRHHDHVPKELSAGVAAMMMAGKRFDGTFPTDRYVQFSHVTASVESAAILSVVNVPVDQLSAKFLSFRALFDAWGFQRSEDTELASAYLSITELGPADVRVKMAIIVDGLRNYLAYPMVAGAILTALPTLEANETLDLMEKAYSILSSYAMGLERSEVVSLSVRMIHGIRNDLVRQLDPTAPISNTPVQFTHAPLPIFFPIRGPLILAHSSYYSTFSSIGGYHPAHVHGFGGGGGGFGG
jgi:hypothetical protein